MARSIALVLILCQVVACRPSAGPVGEDDDAQPPAPGSTPRELRVSAGEPGSGFGSAVALGDRGAWTSAPHGSLSRVFQLDPVAGASEQLVSDGRIGLALATDIDGALLIGAPLLGDGAVLDIAGEPVLVGNGVGRAIARGPVALDANGWTDGAGRRTDTVARGASIASAAALVGVGFPHGSTSARIGDADVPRIYDSEGFSIAAGDLDGDGVPEWAVGAPQANVVRILSSDGASLGELEGSGRYGAALSMADIDGDGRSELLVGAPRAAGDSGEAILYGSDLSERTRYEGRPGDRLGTSVALAHDGILLGAPGGAGMSGAVVW
ncbi:MAG: VCBS repeat-containing protein, partial [Myxococcota bacterium]|nr:VCBS repeat-containing protein [Myxococcota bacterium]